MVIEAEGDTVRTGAPAAGVFLFHHSYSLMRRADSRPPTVGEDVAINSWRFESGLRILSYPTLPQLYSRPLVMNAFSYYLCVTRQLPMSVC